MMAAKKASRKKAAKKTSTRVARGRSKWWKVQPARAKTHPPHGWRQGERCVRFPNGKYYIVDSDGIVVGECPGPHAPPPQRVGEPGGHKDGAGNPCIRQVDGEYYFVDRVTKQPLAPCPGPHPPPR